MIKKITIKNVGSIREEATFDFSRSRVDFKENMLKDDLVNPVSVFGTNGSGKTVFLKAINYLSQLMYKDLNLFNIIPYLGIEIDNTESRNKSYIQIEGVLSGVKYSYEFIYSFDKIVYECIEFNDNKVIRENNEYTINNATTKQIEGLKYSVIKLLGLQEHESADFKFLNIFYEYLRDIVFIDSHGNVDCYYSEINEILVEYSKDVNNILTSYEHFPQYELSFRTDRLNQKKELVFTLDNKVRLPSILMSSGMRSHSMLLSLLFKFKDKESLFLVDEIERDLHSFVSKRLIVDFNKTFNNTQLIFASHNTNLLQHLRPDQIFFSKYSKDKKSYYNKLSDIYKDIREVNNIEKMYYNRKFDV